MQSLGEFFNMGGYAFYVWTSYGIAAVVLVANLMAPLRLRRRLLRDLHRRVRRERGAQTQRGPAGDVAPAVTERADS